MMQYERRYEEKEFQSVEGIDIVLTFAPILLRFDALDELATLLQSERGIDRKASDDLANRLCESRVLLARIRDIFDFLEKQTRFAEDALRANVAWEDRQWWLIVSTWTNMGLIERTREDGRYWLSLVAPTHEVARGKCPTCGATARAEKARFLEAATCPKCRSTVTFVILAQESGTDL
jgi:hypothetical protein